MLSSQGLCASKKSEVELVERKVDFKQELAKLIDQVEQFKVLNNISDLSQHQQILSVCQEDLKKQTDVILSLLNADPKQVEIFSKLTNEFQKILTPEEYKKANQVQYAKLSEDYIILCQQLSNIELCKPNFPEQKEEVIKITIGAPKASEPEKKPTATCCNCLTPVRLFFNRMVQNLSNKPLTPSGPRP